MSIARYGKGTRRTQSAALVEAGYFKPTKALSPAPNGGHGGFEGDDINKQYNDDNNSPQPVYSVQSRNDAGQTTFHNVYSNSSAKTIAAANNATPYHPTPVKLVVDNNPNSGDGGGGSTKIVCTEMYRQTQLPDWSKAMKTWDIYQKKYLTPTHEIGYHWLFRPYVRGMQKNNTLTKLGAYLATERTQHLRHILTKGKAKDSLVGKVWCSIIHPVVYAAGKIKVLKNKIEIMRIKNYGN